MQEEIKIKFEKLKLCFCCKCGKNIGFHKVDLNHFLWCEECSTQTIEEKMFIGGI
jgi:hypothetical protein